MKFAWIALLACLMSKCSGIDQTSLPDSGRTSTARPHQEKTSDMALRAARSIDAFNRITAEMSMKEVIEICGPPAEDIGSGIHIYVYKLSDGSVVRVGTPDQKRLFYVVHVQTNGENRYLVRNTVK
jgi:hypothetical protein